MYRLCHTGPEFSCAPDNSYLCCLQWQEYCKYVLGPEDYKEYVSASGRDYTDARAAGKAIKKRPTPAEAQAQEELTRTMLLLAHASGYDGGRHMAWRDLRGVLLARPPVLSAMRVNAGQGMGIIINDVLHISINHAAMLALKVQFVHLDGMYSKPVCFCNVAKVTLLSVGCAWACGLHTVSWYHAPPHVMMVSLFKQILCEL
jgi:hypothetical protein